MLSRFAPVALLLPALLPAATTYKIQTRYPVPGNGGFDYITFDAASRRIYLSHTTQVDVVDADSGKLVGTITETPGVHGAAIATSAKHGFTSNGGENKVTMFDLETLKPIKKIDVGNSPDGIFYDAATNRVFTENHGSHDITALDAATGDVVGTIKLEGDGEQYAFSPDGNIFVNSEDTAETVIINPKTLQVVKRFPIGVAKTPTGLAYDAKTQRLFIACRQEPKLVVMDAQSGKVIADFPTATGSDWTVFDPDSRQIFVSTSTGIVNVIQQKSANEYEVAGEIMTQQGSRTMTFDPKTKKIFLPSVEYNTTPNADPTKPARRTIKPGTFQVIVLSKD